ncbi:hypothetical protein [Lichenihabitans psoromatis]|uniref:hypothetical protein n=1 Tax=Lichenihabitans psoromatis TaxID=2528642 RepID=UPI0010385695|nr:hypothetical protein [Lichenihabitans psoromatis]
MLPSSLVTTACRASGIFGLAAALACLPALPAQAAPVFAGFTGNWSGSGQIALDNGTNERVRCKVGYTSQAADKGLAININCASDSYKVQVVSTVMADASGTITGSWKELSRDVSGNVVGRIPKPGEISANLEGAPYLIQLSFSTRGNQQVIALQVQNSGVKSIKIALSRN